MKKRILLSVFLCLGFFTEAQNSNDSNKDYSKNEIAVSWGVGSNIEIIDVYTNIFTELLARTYSDNSYSGPITLEYFHHINPRLSFGGMFSYEHASADIFSNWDKTQQNIGKEKSNYFTLMPAAKFEWIHKKTFSLYSKVGAGITFAKSTDKYTNQSSQATKESDSDCYFNFQVSAVGVQFGKKVCGFTEIGFGQQGILSAGVRYRF